MSGTAPDARFERIFRAHFGRILAYARRRTSDPGTAEEVAAETFLVAWRRLDEVPDEPLPWLYGVARKVLANTVRGAARRTALHALLQQEAHVRAADLSEQVRFTPSADTPLLDALRRLDPDDREVLLLIGWEGLSQRECARAFGCSESALARRLRRARRRLTQELTRAEDLGAAARPRPGARPGANGEMGT